MNKRKVNNMKLYKEQIELTSHGKTPSYFDITPQAAELMGKRGKASEPVFEDIHSPSCTNEAIKCWVLRAGIQKEITFHLWGTPLLS